MWDSHQAPDRARNNQNVRVYLRTTLLFNNTIIRPSGVKYRDWDEREVVYKNRQINAKNRLTYLWYHQGIDGT